jgi:hypothetical protein
MVGRGGREGQGSEVGIDAKERLGGTGKEFLHHTGLPVGTRAAGTRLMARAGLGSGEVTTPRALRSIFPQDIRHRADRLGAGGEEGVEGGDGTELEGFKARRVVVHLFNGQRRMGFTEVTSELGNGRSNTVAACPADNKPPVNIVKIEVIIH